MLLAFRPQPTSGENYCADGQCGWDTRSCHPQDSTPVQTPIVVNLSYVLSLWPSSWLAVPILAAISPYSLSSPLVEVEVSFHCTAVSLERHPCLCCQPILQIPSRRSAGVRRKMGEGRLPVGMRGAQFLWVSTVSQEEEEEGGKSELLRPVQTLSAALSAVWPWAGL